MNQIISKSTGSVVLSLHLELTNVKLYNIIYYNDL